MLTKNSIGLAWGIAEALAQRGYVLSAMQESPLNDLSNASIQVAAIKNAAGEPVTGSALADLLGTEVLDGDTVGGEHEGLMQSAVATVTRVVTGNFNVAKNTAVPMIAEVYAAAEEAVKTKDVENQNGGVFVKVMQYPAVWTNPMLHSLLARYSENADRSIQLSSLNLPAPTDFNEATATGSPELDGQIQDLVDYLGVEYLTNLWNRLINGSGAIGDAYSTDRDFVNDALIGFLFFYRLAASQPADVDMSLDEYRAYVLERAAVLGGSVNYILKRRERDARLNYLVYDVRQVDGMKAICVIGDVYSRWVKEGGVPEALFGAEVTMPGLGYSELLSNLNQYVAEWRRIAAAYRMERQQTLYRSAIFAIRGAVTKQIVSAEEGTYPLSKEEQHEILKKELEEAGSYIQDNLYHYCRHVVCKVFFAHMDVELILNLIDGSDVSDSSEDAPKEAAYAAAAEYVTRWIMAQLKVSDVPGFVRA